jgi:hypothetical protein
MPDTHTPTSTDLAHNSEVQVRMMARGSPFDLLTFLRAQRQFSERTFGPGPRAAGIVDHIIRELKEIEADPNDISEWIDVVILALDGAWRQGFSPEQIIHALANKTVKNFDRKWPDWRTAETGKAIEHIKEGLPAAILSGTP